MSLKKDRRAKLWAAVAFGVLILLPTIVPVDEAKEEKAAAGISAEQKERVVKRQKQGFVIVIGKVGEPYRIITDSMPAAAVTPSWAAAGLFKGE